MDPAGIATEVHRLAARYPATPLPVLAPALASARTAAFRLLAEEDAEGGERDRPGGREDVEALVGMVCALTASAQHDLGDPLAALGQAQLAVVHAVRADHPGLHMRLRGLQSLIAFWAGWPHEALRYARLGAAVGGRGGTAATWLRALQARAYADLGDMLAAQAALRQAEHLREHAGADELDAVGGLFTFTEADQHAYRADTLVLVPGAEGRAVHAAQDAIAGYARLPREIRPFASDAGARAAIALAHVALGDVAGAREALGPVLELGGEQRVTALTAQVRRVHARLRDATRFRDARARALQEEIESFCQVPAHAVVRL